MLENPPELENAIAKHRLGQLDEAASVYRALTETRPELAEPWHLLGVIEMQRGAPQTAERYFREALARDAKHIKCLSNLGAALYQLKRLDEAEAALNAALALDANHVDALYNVGNVLLAAGRADDAAKRFERVLALQPAHAKASNNLSEALKYLGRFQEAVDALQGALKLSPNEPLLVYSLIALLNHHMPEAGARGPHAKMQQRLQTIPVKEATPASNAAPIDDEAVRRLYRQSQEPLTDLDEGLGLPWLQMWRGKAVDPGCDRHKVVFDECGVIPEFCFSCYKVAVDVQNITDLLKLMVVFDTIELPNDNARKCFVEVRPEISGAYKGLIYCWDFAEAKMLLQITEKAVKERIANPVKVALKRGCSEFPLAFPEYGRVDDSEGPPMTYPQEWRAIEETADRERVGHQYAMTFESYNHAGLTLKDALILRAWMAYAAAIGDTGYLDITAAPVAPLPLAKRAPFSPSFSNA